jgi:CubicO group peptidase (beta-lactamase class C family)
MFLRAKAAASALVLPLALALAPTSFSKLAAQVPSEQAEIETDLSDWVQSAREAENLIAVGAVIADRNGIIEIAVDGVRAHNTEDAVQVNDTWHLGSTTKAMTALLYADLVNRGLAEWQATLPDLFLELSNDMDPAWQDVTIEDLFAHRSGMRQLGGFWLNARRNDERPVSEQRMETAARILRNPPSKSPSDFDYNNLNYIVAGAAIESILRKQDDFPDTWPDTWEEATRELLFGALTEEIGQAEIGFGPPQDGVQGHRVLFGMFTQPVGRGKNADNPAALGPAGTAHATLRAHALLSLEYLKDDSWLIPVATRNKLFTPHPSTDGDYAMGWGVYDDPKYGRLYLHSGSNTMWTTRVLIAPELDRVVIVNVNQFTDSAQSAIRSISVKALDAALAANRP